MRIAFFLAMVASALALTPPINNFNAGQVSPLLDARTDSPMYSGGSRTQQNMISRVVGDISKRPGTTLGGVWDPIPITGAYPMLHELDASEIPTAPAAPTIADGTTPVANATDLQNMSGAGSYILTGNIDMSGVGAWTPIVNFSGTIDGNGYKIHDWTHNGGASDNQALFATVNDGFKCKDLVFEDCSVSGDDKIAILFSTFQDLVGTTVLIADLVFTRCTIVSDQYGGIIAAHCHRNELSKYYNVTITDCSVSGRNNTGGAFGHVAQYYTDIGDCHISNIIVDNITIVNTPGNASAIGGFSGTVIADGKTGVTPLLYLYNCSASGTITITNETVEVLGGFTGSSDKNVVHVSCYSTVDINISSSLAGDNAIEIGGYTGNESTYSQYINCYSAQSIIASMDVGNVSSVGGFVGHFDATDITHVLRCYSTSDIDVSAPSAYAANIGGFIGIFSFWSTGASGATERDDVIERSWSSGDITATNVLYYSYCGGFFGKINATSTNYARTYGAKNCYTWSQMNIKNVAASTCAGFTGQVVLAATQTMTLDNCYDAQTDIRTGSGYTDELVYASATTGGFIGSFTGAGTLTIATSYWDTTTSGLITTAGATPVGHETCWMWTKQEYEDAGWAFSTVDQVKGDPNDIWYMPADYSCSGGGDNGTPEAARLIPFVFSSDDSYIIAFDDASVGFLRTTGGVSGSVQE